MAAESDLGRARRGKDERHVAGRHNRQQDYAEQMRAATAPLTRSRQVKFWLSSGKGNPKFSVITLGFGGEA